jgi:hypothetical protein
MSGEVSVSNRSSNIWTLERVLQVHEASSTSKPTAWDRWVSFMPVPARFRTQLVDHYDATTADDGLF